MSTNFTSMISLASGVVIEASIDVPDEVAYPSNRGELSEVVQHAVAAMADAYSTAFSPPF